MFGRSRGRQEWAGAEGVDTAAGGRCEGGIPDNNAARAKSERRLQERKCVW